MGGAEIPVAFEVVGQEPHREHERDVQDAIDQGVLFHRCQGGRCTEPARDGLDPCEVETDARCVGFIFVGARRRRADEVAEVEARGAGHDGVEIDDAERARAVGVEQHVADLAIVVRDAVAREFDGPESGKAFDGGAGILRMPRAAMGIDADSVFKRTQAGAQVVETCHGVLEILGRQAAGFVQECAECATRLSGHRGRRRSVHVAASAYEAVQAPELTLGIPMKQSAVRGAQDLRQPVRLCRIQALKVVGDALGSHEHGPVDSLQQVVAAVQGVQAIAIVDVAGAVAMDPYGRGDTEGAGGSRCGVGLIRTRSSVCGVGRPATAPRRHPGW